MSRWTNFDGQFIVSTEERASSEGTRTLPLNSLFVTLHPQIDMITVIDNDDKVIGAFLGTVIDHDTGNLVTTTIKLNTKITTAESINNLVEEEVYKYSGRFIFILDAAAQRRIYLDANGTLSLVYDKNAKLAGATAGVLMDEGDYRERFRSDLYRTLDVDHEGWFPAGLTAHRGVDRLLCNHYLDLDTWIPVRHWPLEALAESHDPELAYSQIGDRVTQTIRALANSGKVAVALTAGNDSRLLLACCRTLTDHVSFVTVEARGADLDLACAKKLANKFNLRHEILSYRQATPAQAALWQLRAGHCVGGVNMTMHPSVHPLDGKIFIGGLGGEIGRGFLWLNAEKDTPLDAASIVSRLKLPQNDEIIEAVQQWLLPIDNFDTLLKLDLAYMELRMSAWGFCDSYTMPNQIELHPIISRQNYSAMLSLPSDQRRNRDMLLRYIDFTWGDILTYPINRYGDWRDPYSKFKAALLNPRKVTKKARQLFYASRTQ